MDYIQADWNPAIIVRPLHKTFTVPLALFEGIGRNYTTIIVYCCLYASAVPVQIPFIYTTYKLVQDHFKISQSYSVRVLQHLSRMGYISIEFVAKETDELVQKVKRTGPKAQNVLIFRINCLKDISKCTGDEFIKSIPLSMRDIQAYGLLPAIVYRYLCQIAALRRENKARRPVRKIDVIQDTRICENRFHQIIHKLEKKGLIVQQKTGPNRDFVLLTKYTEMDGRTIGKRNKLN